jgi:REP element-mobilizing transposase RayT
MPIRERNHRLPRELYKGIISASFALCIQENARAFVEPQTIGVFEDILSSVVTKAQCIVPVYCFMPDHQHLIIMGISNDADLWKTIVSYKQKTGFWLAANKPRIKWQKDFFDHIIRNEENLAAQIRYILDNPARKGIVSSWRDYPFKGSIGCKLEDVLAGLM